MSEQPEIRRALYSMTAIDVAALFVLVLVSRFVAVTLLSAVCVPFLLILNFLFIRNKLRAARQDSPGERMASHSNNFYVYACSVIFFLGTIYGLSMILQGEIPRAILPLLLIPLSFAIYCLRMGLKSRGRRSGT
jgi:hypothetical protein